MIKFKEPYYLVDFNSSICNFEIYINDMPAFIHHEGGSISSHCPINHYILESNEQVIKIRILPLKGEQKLREDGFVKIKVFSYDSSTTDYNNTFEAFKYETPNLEKQNLPIIEYTMKFIAEVPYKIDGWKNSILIKNIENKEKITNYYKSIYEYFKNENITELVKLQSTKFKEIDIAMYLSEDNTRELSNLFSQLKNDKFVLQDFPPLINIQYFGYGKVLSLVQGINTPVIYYKNTKTVEEFFYPIYIHKRVDSNTFEIIR